MPFSDIYTSTFKNDIEYNQLLIQTATALQTNKFIQVQLHKNSKCRSTIVHYVTAFVPVTASSSAQERTGQVEERHQGAVAEGAEENGI